MSSRFVRLAPAVVVALGAAAATAHGLYEVAVASRVPGGIAWLYPVITDGLALVAYSATSRLVGNAARYAWACVVLAAALSGLAQAVYLAAATVQAVPVLRFGVGAWPAVACALVAHLVHLMVAADSALPGKSPGEPPSTPPRLSVDADRVVPLSALLAVLPPLPELSAPEREYSRSLQALPESLPESPPALPEYSGSALPEFDVDEPVDMLEIPLDGGDPELAPGLLPEPDPDPDTGPIDTRNATERARAWYFAQLDAGADPSRVTAKATNDAVGTNGHVKRWWLDGWHAEWAAGGARANGHRLGV